MIKKYFVIPAFILMYFSVAGHGLCEEQPAGETEGLGEVLTTSVRKAIEEVDMQKSAEKAEKEEYAARRLDDFIKRWVGEKGSQRKAGIKAKVDQAWQDLLSTPPQHIDYYLRDYSYRVMRKNITESDSVTYPYNAAVDIEELLYVDQAPLMGEPRSEYQYTADTIMRLNLQYDGASGQWQLVETKNVDVQLKKGWPWGIRKKHSSFFIPTE